MKTSFWKIVEHIFAAIGAATVLFAALFSFYLQRHAMRPVPARELGSRGSGPAVLVATQGSPYKDAVAEPLIRHLHEKPAYVRVEDVSQLPQVDERDWDAIVLLHSWERWQPPPVVQQFVERLKDRRKLVVLTTSGSGESRMACVDAVTSASAVSRAPADSEELLQRVDQVLNPNRLSSAVP
jgi:hypothetical protein